MKSSRELDLIDLRILFEIQRNGRLPIVDLAERVHLSKTPCLQRLRRLEKEKYITGYGALLNPQKVKQGYLVYVQVKLENTSSRTLCTFNEAVKTIPQVLSCSMLSGGYDYLLKVRSADMISYRKLLGDTLSDLPGVLQISTFPVLEEVKDTNQLFIEGL